MIKDSGKRLQLPGMVRDVTDNKIDYSLALDGPLFERLARHLTEGAKKYSKRNWMGAHTKEEYERFRESAIRHFIQYLNGANDEDHFAAVVFNLNGMEYVKDKMVAEATLEAKKYTSSVALINSTSSVGTAAEPIPTPIADRRIGGRRKVFVEGFSVPARRAGIGRRKQETAYWTLPRREV